MNNENPEIKKPEFLNTKKGALTMFFMIFCVSLTFACSLGMLAPTNVSATTTNLTALIDLGNEGLPFIVERDDILNMTFTSFESDLSVTIKNQDDEIIADYPFVASLSLVDSEDDPVTITDEDKDGLIYFDELDGGDYTLELTDSGDYDAPEPLEVTIEPPVEYKAIDVSKEVVPESSVNLAVEDGQFNNNSQSTPVSKDTVEFVESRTEVIEGTKQPLLDAAGNQIYYYVPILSGQDNKFLTYADGTPTDLIAVFDESGKYLKNGKKLTTTVPATVTEEDILNEDGTTTPAGTITTEATITETTVQVIDSSYKLIQYNNRDIKATQITATFTSSPTTVYYGWQTIDKKTYYFDKTGTKVTGPQTIQGVEYFFNDDGSMNNIVGVDVSYWQSTINWTKVKASGVDFAILRIGIMGYTKGTLIEDSTFAKNLSGAKAAGIRVGAYFYDAAITTEEAVKEASLCIQYLQRIGSPSLDYPIFIDMEYSASNARNNDLTTAQRTAICNAFCSTIKSSGYRAGVYASSSYLNGKLNMSSISNNYVWVANWNVDSPNYGGRYDIWQYSDSGKVDGISGGVDMNISYMGY